MTEQKPVLTITKAWVIEEVEKEILNKFDSFDRAKTKRVIYAWFEFIAESLVDGATVYFRNIGRIQSSFKEGGRPVRNPKNPDEVLRMPDTIAFKFSNRISRSKPITKLKVTKTIHIEFLQSQASLEIAEIIYSVFARALKMVLNNEARIEIRGIGTFKHAVMSERLCRNPRTGDKVLKGERSKIIYKASKHLIKLARAHHFG